MTKFLKPMIVAAFAMLVFSLSIFSGAQADAVYPYQNPTYIPSAISPATTLTGTGTYVVTLQNAGTLGVDIRGTCTSLAAQVQVSVDGTNYIAVPAWVVSNSTVTSTATITATGAYRSNVAGAQKARLNVTANSAACAVSAVATGAHLNPNY